ncbi:hypothetical protein CORC01_13692 [Colletotrichum orchidophilum]|uniref:Uncharacterized protein n=1 Tax=Colletotrichum orchidophilum TaxID=1209926 RepID=A0A1G4APH1_9PEZI|nr:uncharacterized protein CORC01_13692 [Colletotrichum orchidophilum]OHE91011.1 hypothetical protein CORC01_13692 [Colletotrichum orchidophilum]
MHVGYAWTTRLRQCYAKRLCATAAVRDARHGETFCVRCETWLVAVLDASTTGPCFEPFIPLILLLPPPARGDEMFCCMFSASYCCWTTPGLPLPSARCNCVISPSKGMSCRRVTRSAGKSRSSSTLIVEIQILAACIRKTHMAHPGWMSKYPSALAAQSHSIHSSRWRK